jgi:histidinol-phosphate aminotransferase
MNLASLQIGVEAVKDEAYFQETTTKIVATRERAKARFRELGFSFPDSMANFIFVTHERVPAKQIFEALKAQQIYVRYFAQPRLENYLRVTVGTDEEMDELFTFLEEYLKENWN